MAPRPLSLDLHRGNPLLTALKGICVFLLQNISQCRFITISTNDPHN